MPLSTASVEKAPAPSCGKAGPRPCLDASAIVLCSRPESLARFLESLARQEGLKPAEVLLVLNGLRQECADVSASFTARLPGLRILAGGGLSLGEGRNAAAAKAMGRWLCFFDDDVVLPEGWFARLGDSLDLHPEASALGGPDRTPPGSTLFQRCVGLVLESPLGSGPIRRHGAGFPEPTWTDDRGLILCGLVLDREALDDEGLAFDPELVRNEENLLLSRLRASGRRCLHDPGLFVFHERRPTARGFCRQCFLSGRGRLQMTLKAPASLKPFHLAPLLPLGAVLGACVLPSFFLPLLACYSLACAANGLLILVRHRNEPWTALPWLSGLPPAAHLCYAAGLLAGAWDRLMARPSGRPART
ncbi:MAG: glycosyltransferase [Elusimicrobiota bacterium]|jgi:GT2 family glycosyltransferase